MEAIYDDHQTLDTILALVVLCVHVTVWLPAIDVQTSWQLPTVPQQLPTSFATSHSQKSLAQHPPWVHHHLPRTSPTTCPSSTWVCSQSCLEQHQTWIIVLMVLDSGSQRGSCLPQRSMGFHRPCASPLPAMVAEAPETVGELPKARVLATCPGLCPVGAPPHGTPIQDTKTQTLNL